MRISLILEQRTRWRAATTGGAFACTQAAAGYAFGLGVPRDLALAKRLYGYHCASDHVRNELRGRACELPYTNVSESYPTDHDRRRDVAREQPELRDQRGHRRRAVGIAGGERRPGPAMSYFAP